MANSKEMNYSALGFTAGILGLGVGIALGLYYFAPKREKKQQLVESRKSQISNKKG